MSNGHGGERSGVQGKGYSNRTDLMAKPERVQPAAAAPAPEQPAPEPAPMIAPDDIPTLTAPTERPNEPLMTGVGVGPGQLKSAANLDPTSITLRLLYQQTGSEDIRRLIAAHEQRSQ